MRLSTLSLAIALLTLPMAAAAQDEGSEDSSALSWSAALASDYVYRGASQTNEDPALQLGLDYDFGNGFYAGAWGSNVDFQPFSSADIEVDTYVGYAGEFSDAWAFDTQLIRYNYFGLQSGEDSLNYVEWVNKLTFNDTWTFTGAFSPDVYNTSESGTYFAVDGGWDLPAEWALHAGFGYSSFDNDIGVENYLDYKIGVSRDFGPVGVDITAYATDEDGETNFGQNADSRIVLTLSLGG